MSSPLLLQRDGDRFAVRVAGRMLSALLSNMLACLATSIAKENLLPTCSPWVVPCPGLWGSNFQKGLGLHVAVQPILCLQREQMPFGAPGAPSSDPWLLEAWDRP